MRCSISNSPATLAAAALSPPNSPSLSRANLKRMLCTMYLLPPAIPPAKDCNYVEKWESREVQTNIQQRFETFAQRTHTRVMNVPISTGFIVFILSSKKTSEIIIFPYEVAEKMKSCASPISDSLVARTSPTGVFGSNVATRAIIRCIHTQNGWLAAQRQ